MSRPLAATALTAVLLATPAAAHLQLVATPEVNRERAGEVPSKLLFRHPIVNGHVVDMGAPEQFFVRFRGERTDPKDALAPLVFTGRANAGRAFEGVTRLTRSGDDTFVVVPELSDGASEDLDGQPITANVVNRGAPPTDGMEPVGLATELVPLDKPYRVIAGSTFSGVGLRDGEPEGGVESEIEDPPAEPDLAADAAASVARAPVAGGAITAINRADASFTFGTPKAGHRSFAAFRTGPASEHAGKAPSQDAVLRVHAHERN